MHKRIQESHILEVLREGNTITAACKKAGFSRMTYNRLYKDNFTFRQAVDEAIFVGKSYMDDFVMAKFKMKIGEGHWPAIRYYAQHNLSPYKEDAERSRETQRVLNLAAKELVEYLHKHRSLKPDELLGIKKALNNLGMNGNALLRESAERILMRNKDAEQVREMKDTLEKGDKRAALENLERMLQSIQSMPLLTERFPISEEPQDLPEQ